MENNIPDCAKRTASFRLRAIIAVAISVFTGIGYFFAMKNSFNFEIGHFDSSVWFWMIVAGIAAALIYSLAVAFSVRKKEITVSLEPSVSSSIIGCVAAAESLLVFCDLIKAVFSEERSVSVFDKITCILFLFVTAYFITTAVIKKKTPALTVGLAVLSALAVNASVFAAYFDSSVPMNGPVRHIMIIVRCAILLFFISEARFALPKGSDRLTPFFAVFVNNITFIISFGVSAGAIAFRCFCPNPADPAPSIAWLMFFLTVSLFAFTRMADTDSLMSSTEDADK